MLKINLSKQAQKFLGRLPPKQRRQVSGKIFQLAADPVPPDSKPLKGFPYRRADIGEYRISIILMRKPSLFQLWANATTTMCIACCAGLANASALGHSATLIT
jgi:mRNA interferase RelE/StbE